MNFVVVLVGDWASGEVAKHGVRSERWKKKKSATMAEREEDRFRYGKDSISVDMEGWMVGKG